MNSEIKYVSFMRSYYDAAKSLTPEERLSFYDAILDYGFEGIDTNFENNSKLNTLLILIKPFIDANKAKVRRNTENIKKRYNKSGKYGGNYDGTLKDKDKDKDREIDKDNNTDTDTDINTEIDKDTDIDYQVHQYLVDNSIDLYNENDIAITLKDNGYDIGYLTYVMDVISQKYPANNPRQNSAMFNQAYKWDNLLSTYHKPAKQMKHIKLEEPAAPTICTECGATLLSNGYGSRICPNCREQGKIIWWELDKGQWEKQQQLM